VSTEGSPTVKKTDHIRDNTILSDQVMARQNQRHTTVDVIAMISVVLSASAIVTIAVGLGIMLHGTSSRGQAASSPKRIAANSVTRDPALGRFAVIPWSNYAHERSRVAIIEFSDFQCPFCGKCARDPWPGIKREFVDTKRVEYVFRNFSLEFHQLARTAAEGARAEGRYWSMHETSPATSVSADTPRLQCSLCRWEHTSRRYADSRGAMA
jgi:protein-disulfide isomerase